MFILKVYAVLITISSVNLYRLNDDKNAREWFVCNSGGLLELDRVCDGRVDCVDGADELRDLCSRTICPQGLFKCYYGACIPKHKKCNGIKDCADGSDEMQCGRKWSSCAFNEFRCHSGQCVQSKIICDGYTDCIDGSDESMDYCPNELCPLSAFKCNYGGCVPIEAQCDGFPDCLDGSDESSVLCLAAQCPECRQDIKCSPIISTRIDSICEVHGQRVSCNQPHEPGTLVTYSCREFFIPANNLHENNDRSLCQRDGTWSRNILECKPDCGRLSSAIPLVVNGWQVDVPFPWHVNLYVKINGQANFWCGATLLTESIVITAAHCVWKMNVNDLQLTMASTKSHLNATEDYVQIYNPKRIIIHPLYFDKYGNYGSDLALIEINGNIEFSERTRPVCIDWHLDDITSHLTDQSLGMVMGMGVTENDQYSDELRATMLPVVSNQYCVDQQKPDFRKYLTFTTFCAGWQNGTGVCNGDSGGGLVFPMKNSDRWCLQGIVSLSPRRRSSSLCDAEQFTIFTKVGIYIRWIENVINTIHATHQFISSRQNDVIF